MYIADYTWYNVNVLFFWRESETKVKPFPYQIISRYYFNEFQSFFFLP